MSSCSDTVIGSKAGQRAHIRGRRVCERLCLLLAFIDEAGSGLKGKDKLHELVAVSTVMSANACSVMLQSLQASDCAVKLFGRKGKPATLVA